MKRSKRRYLALKLEGEGLPSERDFMDALWGSVTRLYGEVGASQAGLVLIDCDAERKIFVVRVSLASLDWVRASVALVTSVAGVAACVHVLAVSGTIKALLANL